MFRCDPQVCARGISPVIKFDSARIDDAEKSDEIKAKSAVFGIDNVKPRPLSLVVVFVDAFTLVSDSIHPSLFGFHRISTDYHPHHHVCLCHCGTLGRSYSCR
jgi:hypothetical protein